MTSVEKYLLGVVGSEADHIWDEALDFLAKYNCEKIDTERKREEYYRVYYGMRSISEQLDVARERAAEIQKEVRSLRRRLNDHSRSKGDRYELQKELSQALRNYAHIHNEIQILKEIREGGDGQNTALDEDWKSIISLRGLRSIKTETDDAGHQYPAFLFRIYYRYHHCIYDLGDIRVQFDPNLIYLESGEIALRERLMHKDGWMCVEPNYIYRNHAFCFGDRWDDVLELVKEYRFTEALMLMDTCFHSIIEEQLSKLPYCFNRLEVGDDAIKALDSDLKERGVI